MNKKMIGKLVGVLFFLEALFMLPAIAVCFVYGETGAPLRGFLWTVALLLALSGALYGVCAKATREFYAKEGFIIVALGWTSWGRPATIPCFQLFPRLCFRWICFWADWKYSPLLCCSAAIPGTARAENRIRTPLGAPGTGCRGASVCIFAHFLL